MNQTSAVDHRTSAELYAGLGAVADAPRDVGRVELIVRRPALLEREVLDVADLDPLVGLVGDTWNQRPSSSMPDGLPHPLKQLTIMSSRAIALFAGDRSRWPRAGDQLYVDLDLSEVSVLAGTTFRVGSALVEVTAAPHTGCAKFTERFGLDAMRIVNSPDGKALRLRGVNARVLEAGMVCAGDQIAREP